MTESMDLKSALAAAQGLVNFYRPLQKLEEVLRVAQAAEQLVSERAKQAAGLAEEIAEKRTALDALTKAAAETIEALDAQKRARQGEIDRADAEARVKRAADAAAFAKQFASAEERANETLAALADEVNALSNRRDGLAAEGAKLEALVSETRARLKGL